MGHCSRCKVRTLLDRAVHIVQSYGQFAIAQDVRRMVEAELQKDCDGKTEARHRPATGDDAC